MRKPLTFIISFVALVFTTTVVLANPTRLAGLPIGLAALLSPIPLVNPSSTASLTNTEFFPVIPYEAGPDIVPSLVPLATNHGLEVDHKNVTRAIIFIHDAYRDSEHNLEVLKALAGPSDASTMIVAPQFLLESDLQTYAARLPDHGQHFLHWQLGEWENGNDSVANLPDRGISSFTVIDLLLIYLSDKNFFPNMQQIVLAGISAGGNFTQRYAAVGRAPAVLVKQNLPLRFVVADASSYLYLSHNRPFDVHGKSTGGFGPPEDTTCTDYNAWPYGLEQLNPYARQVGANEAKTHYAEHAITYLNATPPEANQRNNNILSVSVPDVSCAALAEGKTDAERTANYAAYLKNIYGNDVVARQNFVTLAKPGDDMKSLFGSACGAAILFGDGTCLEPSLLNARNPL